jgi:hypothetical protein
MGRGGPFEEQKGLLKERQQFQSMLKKTSKNCPDKCYSPYPRMDEMKIEHR